MVWALRGALAAMPSPRGISTAISGAEEGTEAGNQDKRYAMRQGEIRMRWYSRGQCQRSMLIRL